MASRRRLSETLVAFAENLEGFESSTDQRFGTSIGAQLVRPESTQSSIIFIGIEFVRQNPSDHEEEHDHPERDQGTALAWILSVIIRHEQLSDQMTISH